MNSDEIQDQFNKIKNGNCHILYVTPERILNSSQMSNLMTDMYQRKKLRRFVVDEVHCISEWGHDFRPNYSKLGLLKSFYPEVPFMCLTATASRATRLDISKSLPVDFKLFITSFNRDELQYTVKYRKSADFAITDIATTLNKCVKYSAIAYCLTRKDCEKVSKILQEKQIKCGWYHAGMTDFERQEIHTMWKTNDIKVICATNAFGLGVDKVRI